MTPDRFIGEERIESRKTFCEGHLVIEQVQPVMALAADRDAPVEFFPRVVFAKTVPAVQFSRDQVVKGQPCRSPA